jgi:nucleotide-binding universal stress UspA family protein
MFNKIIVAIDLAQPELADRALRQAADLAKASGGEVRLVYVRPFMVDAALAYLPDDFFETEEKESVAALKAMVAPAGLSPERTSVTSPTGGVYDLVLAAAEQFKADLVVIGSRRPAMSTYLLGSNASRIVRHATSSVLVVR